MPLTIFDIRIDGTREVTQGDIDRLVIAEQAYGRLRAALAETHAWVRSQIAEIDAREAMPTQEVENERPTGDL